MNTVEVSAGNVSPVYCMCIQHSSGFAIRHEATAKNMTCFNNDKLHYTLPGIGLLNLVKVNDADAVLCIGHTIVAIQRF